ncbi:MAG TPA: acylphosphatase [Roseiarcus sp.]|nr:acylphosphatase [Roseiarcus sp.]
MDEDCEFAEVIVRGRVQGVGYREFARRSAERHGVAGFVRNRADDAVEARLVGPAAAVEAMLGDLRKGPPHAAVAEVKIVARGLAAREQGFLVRPTI